MSLTSMINENVRFREILEESAPSRKFFVTNTGDKPFSNTSELKVPYRLKDIHDAALVGTASDYMFRFSVAKTIVTDNKYDAINETIAEKTLARLEGKCEDGLLEKIKAYVQEGKHIIRKYIDKEITDNYQIARFSIGFAYLDNLYRSEKLPKDTSELFECKSQELLDDVVKLTIVFEQTFIDSGIVRSDSDVVFNPHFGEWGARCGGADADIFIDGTLYDFKCTKDAYCNEKELLQLYGYFLLHEICRQDEDDKEIAWIKKDIRRIAIYKGRHGVINSCLLNRITADFSPEVICRVRDIISAKATKEQKFLESIKKIIDTVEKKKNTTGSTIYKKSSVIKKSYGWNSDNEDVIALFYLRKKNIYVGGVSSAKKYVENHSRVFYPSKGTGTVSSAYIFRDEAFVGIEFDNEDEMCEIRCIDFFMNAYIIYENKKLAEGENIFVPHHGYGMVNRLKENGRNTEVIIKFKNNQEKIFLKEFLKYYIAERPELKINSSRSFPYGWGKAVLDGRIKVEILYFVKNNGVSEVVLRDSNGQVGALPLGEAVLRLSEEVEREDIIIRDCRTNMRLFINERLKVGTEIYIERHIDGNLTKRKGKIIEITKKDVYVVLVECDVNKRIRLLGGY